MGRSAGPGSPARILHEAGRHIGDGGEMEAEACVRLHYGLCERLAERLKTQGYAIDRRRAPCPCVCNFGGFCGGCGHAGCGGR